MNLLKVHEYRENLVNLCFPEKEIPKAEYDELCDAFKSPLFNSTVFVPFEKVSQWDDKIMDKTKWTDALKAMLMSQQLMKPTPDGMKISHELVHDFMMSNFSRVRLEFIREYASTVLIATGNIQYNEQQLAKLVKEVNTDGWNVDRIRNAMTFVMCMGEKVDPEFKRSTAEAVQAHEADVFVPWARVDQDDETIEDQAKWMSISMQWVSCNKHIFKDGGKVHLNPITIGYWLNTNFSKMRCEFVAQYAAFVNSLDDITHNNWGSLVEYTQDLESTANARIDLIRNTLQTVLPMIDQVDSPESIAMFKETAHTGLVMGMKLAGMSDEDVDAVAETWFDKIDGVIDGSMTLDEFLAAFE